MLKNKLLIPLFHKSNPIRIKVCNKYFLKSHLQNKHGVQLEDYLAMYFPNAVNTLATTPSAQHPTSQTTTTTTTSATTTPEQQQAAALVAAAVANELIENHAQSLNISTLNQVVAAKLITNSANRLATSSSSTASPSPDPYQAKQKPLNGVSSSSSSSISKPMSHRNSPLVASSAALNSHHINGSSPLASHNNNGLHRKSIALENTSSHLNG